MTRFLGLLVLCLWMLPTDIQALDTQTSTVVAPRIEMSLRDGWRFKLGSDSATELQAEPDGAFIREIS
jgi:beta-galactosidase